MKRLLTATAIALVALTVLLAIALASGYGLPFDDIPVADNWEW